MAERLPPEPSPAARELLRAFREHESPPRHARERGWQALQTRLHDSTAAANGAANGGYYVKVAAVTVGLAAAVLLALKVVGAGVTALAGQARQPAMEAPYHGEASPDGGQAIAGAPKVVPPRRHGSQGAVEHEAAVIDAAPTAVEVAPAATPTPHARPSATSSSSSTSTIAPSTTADDLQAEVALLKRATRAKQDGRHADGLALLREHAERFPRGTLADERVVLRAELLCASGRVGEARAEARAFLRERAGSALAGRMQSVCIDSNEP
jgi:hypothetical protein